MIYRICVEVPIEKSGKWRRPKIELEKGFNLRVLEYKEDKAIVEIWCSDHEILKPEERKDKSDLDNFVARHKLNIISDYLNRPKIIGRISIVVPQDKIDKTSGRLMFRGQEIRFLRAKKYRDKYIKLILDEG